MLKKLRIIFDPIFWMLLALGLGYAFSAAVLKGLIPDSWTAPGALLPAVGFYFVLRWLRADDVPQPGKPSREVVRPARCTTARRHKSVWRGLYGHGRRKQFKGAGAHAAPKLNRCS